MSTIELPPVEIPAELEAHYPHDLPVQDLHSKTTALARRLAIRRVEEESEAAERQNQRIPNDAFWARVDSYDQELTATRLPELTAVAQHLERLKVAREQSAAESARAAAAAARAEQERAAHTCAICGATNLDPLGIVATRNVGRLGLKSCGRCYVVALDVLASRSEHEKMADGRTRRDRVAATLDKAGA
ncbi:MAG: hypothetical protein EAS51_12790 [Microbacteriaceae bacterium]|nr:MAG: hypothetical protein EAS51_12790 [Microbacteriaceae bacterium]